MVSRAVCVCECLDYVRIQAAQLSQLLLYFLLLFRPYFNCVKEHLLRGLSHIRVSRCRFHYSLLATLRSASVYFTEICLDQVRMAAEEIQVRHDILI